MWFSEISLVDCAKHIVDNRGRTCPVVDKGMPLIATNCLRAEGLYPTYDTTRFVSEETYSTWFRGHPKPGDIILVTKGSPGRVCLAPDPVDFCIAQDMVAIRADESKVYPRYLFAALRSHEVQNRIKNMHVGTLIPHFKKGDFDKLLLPIPDVGNQRKIGDFYFDLSSRIDLLQRTNTTLEAVAQAIFKSWFVDFDPVRAKAEGREPEGMPPEIAELFPSEFEKSELGLVPIGWEAGNIGNIANVVDCLHSKKPELLVVGHPFLQLNNIRNDGLLDTGELACISEADYQKWISRIEVSGGDCVITNVGRVGAVAQIPEGFKAAMGRNMTAIRLLPEYHYPTYLIELLQSSCMRVEIENKTDSGTILNALNVKSIPLLRCVVAPYAVMEVFESITRPLRASMEENVKRIQTIASLRDTLLPRLMSGKLRIPDDGGIAL